MTPLSYNLFVIYITQLTVTNVIEFLSPYVNYYLAARSHDVKIFAEETFLTSIERQMMKNDYDPITDCIKDFAVISIQYGFMTLFIPALPVASLFSLLYNLTQIKIDGSKLLHSNKRPFPMQDDNIGTWQPIFVLISTLAIFTNGALVFFTMKIPQLSDWKGVKKVTWMLLINIDTV